MAESLQISNVSHRHEAIISYLIAHPDAKLGDVAREFGYTQSHLSVIIHSDAFRMQLAEKQKEFHSELTRPIKERLHAVATKSLDKVETMLDCNAILDVNALVKIAEMAMDRVGHAPPRANQAPAPGGGFYQQNNFYGQPPEDRQNLVQAARERIVNGREVISGECAEVDTSAPKALPAGGTRAESGAGD